MTPQEPLGPLLRAAGEKLISVLAPTATPLEGRKDDVPIEPTPPSPPSSPDSFLRKPEPRRGQARRESSSHIPKTGKTVSKEGAEEFEGIGKGVVKTTPTPARFQKHLCSDSEHEPVGVSVKAEKRKSRTEKVLDLDEQALKHMQKAMYDEQFEESKTKRGSTQLGIKALEDLRDAMEGEYFVSRHHRYREEERLRRNVEVAVEYASGEKVLWGEKVGKGSMIRGLDTPRLGPLSKGYGKEGSDVVRDEHLENLLKNIQEWNVTKEEFMKREEKKKQDSQKQKVGKENDNTGHRLLSSGTHSTSKHHEHKLHDSQNHVFTSQYTYIKSDQLPKEETIFATAMSRPLRTPAKASLSQGSQNVPQEHQKHRLNKGPASDIISDEDIHEHPVPGSFPQDILPGSRQHNQVVSKPIERSEKSKDLATFDREQAFRKHQHDQRRKQKHDKHKPATIKPLGHRELDENGMIPLMDGPVIVSRKLGKDGKVMVVPAVSGARQPASFETVERQVLSLSKAEDGKGMGENLFSNNSKDDSQLVGASPEPVKEIPWTAEGRLERVRQHLGPMQYHSSESE
ncbi:hypothetical protein HYFRA_00001958 [Hymenoscyphus fraxineus]|uniref:Uncharacterized protein n=1 Tax=Hymenoscyphus fraxineus TaxID=746836 RepID=A0A9N9KJN8_9HELO|nr:hypothetical protein HYFRA_00001958 [Hymenoscyphus fraxineus]